MAPPASTVASPLHVCCCRCIALSRRLIYIHTLQPHLPSRPTTEFNMRPPLLCVLCSAVLCCSPNAWTYIHVRSAAERNARI